MVDGMEGVRKRKRKHSDHGNPSKVARTPTRSSPGMHVDDAAREDSMGDRVRGYLRRRHRGEAAEEREDSLQLPVPRAVASRKELNPETTRATPFTQAGFSLSSMLDSLGRVPGPRPQQQRRMEVHIQPDSEAKRGSRAVVHPLDPPPPGTVLPGFTLLMTPQQQQQHKGRGAAAAGSRRAQARPVVVSTAEDILSPPMLRQIAETPVAESTTSAGSPGVRVKRRSPRLAPAPPAGSIPDAPALAIPAAPPLDSAVPAAPPLGVPAAPPLGLFGSDSDAGSGSGSGSGPVPGKTPTRRMKKLHWTTVHAGENTLWAELADTHDELPSGATAFDAAAFETRFSAKPLRAKPRGPARDRPDEAGSDKHSGGGSGLGLTGSSAKKLVSLVDANRARNVGIGLARFRMSHEALRDAIVQLDDSILTEDKLTILAGLMPSFEELKAVQAYKGDASLLGPVERFFACVGGVPSVQRRVELMLFRAQFEHTTASIERLVAYVEQACKEIRNSKHLRTVLVIVLKLGNYMNGGQNASGFRLSALLALRDTRDVQNKSSLLHYLIEHILSECPEAMEFASELAHVQHAGKVDSVQLAKEVKSLHARLQPLKQELAFIGLQPHNDTNERFKVVMSEFYDEAQERSERITERLDNAVNVSTQLAMYLGETFTQWEELYKSFALFIQAFKTAHNEVVQQKQKEIEEQRRKERTNARIKANPSEPATPTAPRAVFSPIQNRGGKQYPQSAAKDSGKTTSTPAMSGLTLGSSGQKRARQSPVAMSGSENGGSSEPSVAQLHAQLCSPTRSAPRKRSRRQAVAAGSFTVKPASVHAAFDVKSVSNAQVLHQTVLDAFDPLSR